MAQPHQNAILLGGPSSIAKWVVDLVQTACAAAKPKIELRTLNSKAAGADLEAPQSGTQRILHAQYPNAAVVERVRNGQTPVVAVLEDPLDAVAYMQGASKLGLLEAIRSQTAAAAANLALRNNPQVMLVHRGRSEPIAQLVGEILGHLGIALAADALDRVCARFTARGDGEPPLELALAKHIPGHAPPKRATTNLAEDKTAVVISRVLDPLVRMGAGAPLEAIRWPLETFLWGDKPNQPAPSIVEATGPARVLYYGPYFHLPPANFTVQFVLALSHDVAGLPLALELHGKNLLSQVHFTARKEGAFTGSFTYPHTEPQHPIEARLLSRRGAIEGRLGLAEMSFTPLET